MVGGSVVSRQTVYFQIESKHMKASLGRGDDCIAMITFHTNMMAGSWVMWVLGAVAVCQDDT